MVGKVFLVFPPISNQAADKLSERPDVREQVKRSQIYAIAQREEILFEDLSPNPDHSITFGLRKGQVTAGPFRLSPQDLVPDDHEWSAGDFEFNPYILRFWTWKNGAESEKRVAFWYTPDLLLWEYWNGRLHFSDKIDIRKFTRFSLKYVGISKNEDSLSRLFIQGHTKRAKILSNETQLRNTARLTDEIIILLFDVEQSVIQLGRPEEIKPVMEAEAEPFLDKTSVIADLEKALVKMLEPKYNEVRYVQYPQGVDGLYREGLSQYSYALDETIELETDSVIFRGVASRDPTASPNELPDLITVQGDQVSFIKWEGAD
jgi:hypothetical protein